MNNSRWAWLLLAVALAGLGGLTALSCRGRKAALRPGGYIMHAHGEAHEVSFREDGFFTRAVPGQGFWRGTWRQRGAIVEVKEEFAGRGREPRAWTLTLTSPTEGTLGDGTAVRLEVRGRR